MASPRYLVTIKTQNLRVEIRVNDIPVISLLPGEADMPAEVPVNEFLVSGSNVVSVILHAGPVPSQVKSPWTPDEKTGPYAGISTLVLRIARYAEDQDTTRHDPPPLLSVDWSGVAAPVPQTMERELVVGDSIFPWAWISAERFARLDATTYRPAFDLLNHLHQLLVARQIAEFVAAMRLKLDEITIRAYGVSREPMLATMTRVLEQYSSDPAWTLLPLDPDAIDLRLVADGRLIECLRKDGHRALQYVRPDNQSTFFLPAMVGRFNSSWQVLR